VTSLDELIALHLAERRGQVEELVREHDSRAVDVAVSELVAQELDRELELRRNGGTAVRRDPDALADAPRSTCVGSG
jgi:hypothetical protein